jgi:nucleoside-diphosphate-sugar epimerase
LSIRTCSGGIEVRRLAVTGANGFVGRHVVQGAAAAGWHVTGIVRSAAAAEQVTAHRGRPIVVSAPDLGALAGALAGAEAVVHLAQIGGERGGATYEAVNVGGSERLVEAARRAGVRRLVFFSGLGVARYGIKRRVTNRYFLSKLAAEAVVFRSGLESTVFRPSFIVGPGDLFSPMVLDTLARGPLERPGDGSYRMQPIAVADAAALVLAALARAEGAFPVVFDLVGPEPISYARLLERLVAVARGCGRALALRVREIALAEAERRARDGGFLGMLPDELDCLLCDEVSDPGPLEALLGRPLLSLDAALTASVRASLEPSPRV